MKNSKLLVVLSCIVFLTACSTLSTFIPSESEPETCQAIPPNLPDYNEETGTVVLEDEDLTNLLIYIDALEQCAGVE